MRELAPKIWATSTMLVLLTGCSSPPSTDADGDGIPASQDCDDADPSVGAPRPETCNGVDDNCNGSIDEDPTDAKTWYRDGDSDGFGLSGSVGYEACSPPAATVPWVDNDDDCNDASSASFPGAVERCDGLDNDCNGRIDDEPEDPLTFYRDADNDLYGSTTVFVEGCFPSDGYIGRGGDCDDGDELINPGAPETCNTVDDDCDGFVDTGAVDAPTWWRDGDGDGFAATGAEFRTACEQPSGFTDTLGDCNDAEATIRPGIAERCDGVDTDCDPTSSEDGLIALDGVTVTSLEDAASAATAGSEIAICAGSWSGNLTFADDISLIGPQGAARTTLSPAAAGRPILRFDGAGALTISDLTFDAGNADLGGAIFSRTASTITVRDSTFTNNKAIDGGAIYGDDATSLILSDCTFSTNSASGDGGAVFAGPLTVERSTFSDNSAGARGGALCLSGGDAIFDPDTAFTDNSSDGSGGAIAILTANSITDGEVSNNTAADDGGGIWMMDDGSVNLTVISGNEADRGGGIACVTDCTIDAATIELNAADSGAGIAALGTGTVSIDGSQIRENSAANDGGGLWIDGATLELDSCIIEENDASSGGGAYLEAGSLESSASDWGTGSSDNTPDDVAVGSAAYDTYGASSSFTCLSSTGECS